MLKKSITYTNPFTDEEVTEEHYFHISKADLIEMEMEEHNLAYKAKDGKEYTGMQAKLMTIIDSEDGKEIIATLKEIVRRSYGQKVGERFVKSPEVWAEFSSSEAFSQLLFELCTDPEAAAGFANGVVPSGLAAEAANIVAMQSADISDREEAATVTQLHRTPEEISDISPLQETSQGDSAVPADPEPTPPGEIETTLEREPRVITEAEAREMDSNELKNKLMQGYTLATDRS